MNSPRDRLAAMSPEEQAAINAYVAEVVARAPELTPELAARLRPILAPPPDEQSGAA